MNIQSRSFGGSVAMMVTLGFVLAAVADILFYDHVVGWTVGLFIMLWATAVALKRPGKAVWGCWCVVLGVAVSLAIEPDPWNLFMAVLTLVCLAVVARHGMTMHVILWAKRLALCAFVPLLVPLTDMALMNRWKVRHPGSQSRVAGKLLVWVIPIVLGSVFLGLFSLANPVISNWFEGLRTWLGEQFESFAVDRIFLWCVVLLGTWCLLRLRLLKLANPVNVVTAAQNTGNLGASATPPTTPPTSLATKPASLSSSPDISMGRLDKVLSPAVVLRCLIVFNMVFALQTALDVRYLLYGAQLPEGMSHSMYARRGAYPLVATALLAGLFVLVTFRQGAMTEKLKTARQLVYFWIAQNLFLLASAAWRLSIYIEAYTLTRWRFAAGIWMGMVAIGFGLIIWRIITSRSNAWLGRSNSLLLIMVLYACCFINFDGIIASYNVSQCHEIKGTGVAIDLDYLDELGIESIPALRELEAHSSDTDKAIKAARLANDMTQHIQAQLDDWRGWTWRRAALRGKTMADSQ